MIFKIIAKMLSHPRIFNYLLKRAKKTPYSHIYGVEDNELYMERYWLFNAYPVSGEKRRFNWLPIAIRVHKIVKEDNDIHLHDHPWNARTFILKGWYQEKRQHKTIPDTHSLIKRNAGDTATLKFGEYHKITQISIGGVYTLFVTGKYQGTWGFLVNKVKVNYKVYLNILLVEFICTSLFTYNNAKNGNTKLTAQEITDKAIAEYTGMQDYTSFKPTMTLPLLRNYTQSIVSVIIQEMQKLEPDTETYIVETAMLREVKEYLTAVVGGGMSRNNSEALAEELLDKLP
jgi:hypothetical protein